MQVTDRYGDADEGRMTFVVTAVETRICTVSCGLEVSEGEITPFLWVGHRDQFGELRVIQIYQ